MIFPVGLKVLGQMLDPAGKKCDLHIRAAGVFDIQLKLLKTHRFGALCHNEAPIVDEERILATGHDAGFGVVAKSVPFLRRILFPLPVIPKAELRTRTDSAWAADDYAKEF